ncbi:MAG: L-histidine N(alpha)-methyltransferase [Proteobacteria bacterium]|nr:L-histidine N(alpha)-methyltransferase [Pseudomonadota bacterium]
MNRPRLAGRAEAADEPDEAARARAEFRADVLAGLARPAKAIPAKYFYDTEGSRLFEEICRIEEYYLTRTEIAILGAHAGEIAGLIGPGARLIEFGSGASVKVRLLLDALAKPRAYVPVDISREHLFESARALAGDYPDLDVVPVVADFTRPLALPAGAAAGRPVAFFPGSTIGNFTPGEAATFMRNVARLVGPGGGFLVGVDLKKDKRTLLAAYDDAKGVTAAFNRNLLARINRELGATFDLSAFSHSASYNAEQGRIEMYLVSRKPQAVRIAGRSFRFLQGEAIHTENSYKYEAAEFRALAEGAGFAPRATWTDPGRLFSVHYLEAR